MNETKIKKDIKDTLDNNVPDVLSSIKASPQFRVPEKPSGFDLKSLLNNKMFATIMGMFVVALVIVTAYNRSFNPVIASTITIDVNPSIQINLDEDDYVVSVIGLNDDGEEIASQDINYNKLTLERCIEVLVDRLEKKGYIVTTSEENNIVLIDVQSNTDTRQASLETLLQTKLNQEMEKRGITNNKWVLNSKDIKLSPHQREQLLQDELLQQHSKAKLTLIYRIYELDNSVNIRELAQLPIRQLYNLYINLEDQNNLPDYENMPKPPRHRESSYNPITTIYYS